MKSTSNCVRNIIVSAWLRGESVESIIEWTGVSRATVYNTCKQFHSTNTVAPKKQPGRPSRLSKADYDSIRDLILHENDITLEEIIERLNLPIKKSRLSVITIEMGFSFKKRASVLKSSNEKMSKKSVQHGKPTRNI